MDAVDNVRREITQESIVQLPYANMPLAPDGATVWLRLLQVAWIWMAWHYWDEHISIQFFDFWIFQELGFESIFWTNFWMRLGIWAVTLLLVTVAIATPAFVLGFPRRAQWVATQIGLFAGLIFAPRMANNFLEYLEFFNSRSFGVDDPVFNRDVGYYVFDLPAIQLTLELLLWITGVALASSVICSYLAHAHASGDGSGRARPLTERQGALGYFPYLLGAISTPYTLAMVGLFGVLSALNVWMHRFDVLLKDNSESAVYNGAEALDITGFFSTLNDYYVTAIIWLAVTAAVLYIMHNLRRAITFDGPYEWRQPVRNGVLIAVVLIGLDFGFKAGIMVRDNTMIKPNEPVVQTEFLQRHVDATLTGYGIDDVEAVVLPAPPEGAPNPDVDEMLASASLRNAPLWPGFVSSLEHILDPQHEIRLEAGLDEVFGGDLISVYGPTLDTFRQEQRLRGYYDFVDIDTVRYDIDGEQRMFVSSVRETPVDPGAPKPWLLHWAQSHILYTHGHGLVIVPTNEIDADGGPNYYSGSVPSQATHPELELTNEAVYYYEGAETGVAFTNARNVKQAIASTDVGLIQQEMPEGIGTGIDVDSFWKRVIYGEHSDSLLQVIFSDLIGDETQAMTYRIPIDRAEAIAPFLYIDTDQYAVAADGDIVWMLNGMTTSASYPYSRIGDLGDKSAIRSPHTERENRIANYIEDSVKITINGYTGETTFYKISDAPVVETWAGIYPDLFTDPGEMPQAVRDQLTYPVQLFHVQFDDIYWQYHMRDALEYYFAEDIWDDADEVLGDVLAEGEAITFSIEPFNVIVDTGGLLPDSTHGTQFALAKVFTPEAAVNLRAMPMAYQDGDDYGRLIVAEVPKGQFIPGPEQADAAIDQEPNISEQISWWNRDGNQVIRGHTTPLIVGDELIYVEPLFVRSSQNPLPQLKRVLVVYRGHAAMGVTLEEALRAAVELAGDGDETASAP